MKSNKRSIFKVVLLLTIIITMLSGCAMDENETSYDEVLDTGGAYSEQANNKPVDKVEEIPEKDSETIKEPVKLEGEDIVNNGQPVNPKSDKLSEELDKQEPIDKDSKEPITEKLKIVSIFNLSAESKEIDEDIEIVEDKVHDLGGYISSHNVRTNEEDKRMNKVADISIRVPKDNVGEVIGFIKDNLSITAESSEAIDITDRYYDTEASIKNLESQETQLMELYKKTDNVAEIIMINEKLTEVIKEKELLTRNYMGMKDKTIYSRLNLKIEEVSEFTMIESTRDTSAIRIKNALTRSLIKLKVWITNGVVFVAGSIPVILLVALGLFIYNKYFKKWSNQVKKEVEESNKNKKVD